MQAGLLLKPSLKQILNLILKQILNSFKQKQFRFAAIVEISRHFDSDCSLIAKNSRQMCDDEKRTDDFM